ncbi:hypothetical protein BAE44_0003534 [Dichanthelium oligosanthes]|uniref:Uncharacterized protein n=1 Tax=Dichanthelium oligosanthes TaxID=888268 RepID=A0A1E5WDJ6_9POAL|nr:hypothetical protein BAE44_0003534 [Dichanthelium oligosanthes]
MERHNTSARLPAMLLAMLLLLATELASFGCCGHRIPRADVAAWRHGRVTAVAATARTTTAAARSATAPAATRDAEAVLGESKRLVPQGSNPLHN